METIVLAGIILGLGIAAIWYYNRQAGSADINRDGKVDLADAGQALKNARDGLVQDTRDVRDAVLAQASESAARAQALIDSKVTGRSRNTSTAPEKTTKKSAASKKPKADKKPAVRAKTVGTGRTRTKKST